jgi:hypothetical protein
MTDGPSDGAGDVERYEQLRQHACVGDPSGWRLGLALLERRGVVAWARAWKGTAAAPASPTPSAPAVQVPAAGDQLVGALATMALARVAGGEW